MTRAPTPPKPPIFVPYKTSEVDRLLSNFVDIIIKYGTDSQESVDYPDIGIKVAKAVSENKAERGILICHTGVGMSLVANKVPHIRAALCISPEIAELARIHNNANLLVLGNLETKHNEIEDIVKIFLETNFEKGGRHERRVKKIHDLTGV